MPNSLLAGNIQGISPIRGLAVPGNSEKGHEISFLWTNSLRILTGNFLRPCRELNRAIREVSAVIGESRFRPRFWHSPMVTHPIVPTDFAKRCREGEQGRRQIQVSSLPAPEPRVAGGTEGSNPSTRESVANRTSS